MTDLIQVSTKVTPERVERHWVAGKKQDLPVYRIPITHIYFNIENGRYADRMLRLRREHPGEDIDPREEKWKLAIERMLAGEHEDTTRDKSAFDKLKEDIQERDQLRPGVVLPDGGVLDGNRRLAVLRRLAADSKNPSKYEYFEGVILPEDTSAEDRWRIEAGLQLGISERWDYSPVNEMLKIRQGLRMYDALIAEGHLPGTSSAIHRVASAIYGKADVDIQEMADRLQLIDEYLQFIDEPEAYDKVEGNSEDFLEARRIVTAAENHQIDPAQLIRLKAVLFYLIRNNMMDNYELRGIYRALGGDPKKGGRKEPDREALRDLLAAFPDARDIQSEMSGTATGEEADDAEDPAGDDPQPAGDTGSTTPRPATDLPLDPVGDTGAPVGQQRPAASKQAQKPKKAAKPKVDREKAEAAVEAFKRRMEAAAKRKSVRQIASSALAELQNLEKQLAQAKTISTLSPSDRSVVRDTLSSAKRCLEQCLARIA